MTDDDLDRHVRDILTAIMGPHNAADWLEKEYRRENARVRLRLALAAARREGAEEMRERCIALAESPTFDTMYIGNYPVEDIQRPACNRIAAAIRALPTGEPHDPAPIGP